MRANLLVGLVLLAFGIGVGCASTNGSSDGGGTGGTGGSTGQGGSATGGTGAGGQSATDCSPACPTDQICVGTGTQGGAVVLPVDGGCPAGSHITDPGGAVAFCERDLAYTCAPMPSACNGTLACACATSLCPTGPYSCQVASARELLCVEQVP
jgi:hypothetical protein